MQDTTKMSQEEYIAYCEDQEWKEYCAQRKARELIWNKASRLRAIEERKVECKRAAL